MRNLTTEFQLRVVGVTGYERAFSFQGVSPNRRSRLSVTESVASTRSAGVPLVQGPVDSGWVTVRTAASGTFSTMKVLVFCAAFLSVVLAGCGDSTDSQLTQLQAKSCGGSEPEGVCNAITECVWTGENTSACLQICESTEQDCNEGEKCRRRLLRTSAGRFESTFVCFPEVEPADTPEEQESRTAFCAAHPLESCMRARECSAMVAPSCLLKTSVVSSFPRTASRTSGRRKTASHLGRSASPRATSRPVTTFPATSSTSAQSAMKASSVSRASILNLMILYTTSSTLSPRPGRDVSARWTADAGDSRWALSASLTKC